MRLDVLDLDARADAEAEPPDLDPQRRLDGREDARGAAVAREAAEHDRHLEQELRLGEARDLEPAAPRDDEAVGGDLRLAGVVVEAEPDPQEQVEALVLHLELEPRVDVLDVADRDGARLVRDVDRARQLRERRQVLVLEHVCRARARSPPVAAQRPLASSYSTANQPIGFGLLLKRSSSPISKIHVSGLLSHIPNTSSLITLDDARLSRSADADRPAVGLRLPGAHDAAGRQLQAGRLRAVPVEEPQVLLDAARRGQPRHEVLRDEDAGAQQGEAAERDRPERDAGEQVFGLALPDLDASP